MLHWWWESCRVSLIKHFHCSSPHVAITPGMCTSQCLLPSIKSWWRLFCLFYLFFLRGRGRRHFPISFLTKSFPYKSFPYKFIQSRCKQFHVLGLKNEEYSPQMCKLYFKWSKFSCNLSAWGRIETTRMEMTLKTKTRFQIQTTVLCFGTIVTYQEWLKFLPGLHCPAVVY